MRLAPLHRPLALAVALAALLPGSVASARSVLGGGVLTLGMEIEETEAVRAAFGKALADAAGSGYAEGEGECGGEVACHCAAARKAGKDLAAFGSVARMDTLVTLELTLVGAQACAVENSVFVNEKLTEAQARDRLAPLVRQLLVAPENVSETGAKSAREIDRVPALVTVVTAQQIRDWGITSIGELARFVPGFEVLDAAWGDRVLQYGLPNTILLMVDGIPRNDPTFWFGAFRYDFDVNPLQVDRVEFIRGPGSVLWGSNAFLGIINFITRSPSRSTPSFAATARYGTAANYEAHAEVEQAGRWLSYAFSATFQSREGVRSDITDSKLGPGPDGSTLWGNSGTTSPRPGLYYDIVGRVRLKQFEFLADYIHSDRYFQVSPDGYLLDRDGQGFWKNRFGFFQLSWEDELGAGFRARVALSRFQRNNQEGWVQYPADPRTVPDGLRYVQGNATQPSSSDLVEARLSHTYSTPRVVNRALLGVSFNYLRIPDAVASTVGVYEEPTALNVDFPAQDWWTLAAFLQDEAAVDDHWSLSGGLRYEAGRFKPVLKKQAALLYTGPQIRAKLLYSEGYRTPEGNAIFSTVGTQGNPDLQPENSRAMSAELGWQPHAALTLTAGGSWLRLFDLIVYEDLPPESGFTSHAVNSKAQIDVLAGYLLGRVTLGTRLEAHLNYTYKALELIQDPSSPTEGFYVAPHTASLALVGKPFEDFSCFLTVTFLGPRPILLETAAQVVRKTVPATVTSAIGFSIRKLYLQNLSLDLKLENPFDVSHVTPNSVRAYPVALLEPRSGRELWVTLRWTP